MTSSTILPKSETASAVSSIAFIAFSAGLIASDNLSERLEKPLPKALSNKAFLASDILLMNPLRTSLTDVHNSLASSKSPIIICQVLAQPEPRASFKVSINCVNVLTFVADSPAVFAISAIAFASSCVYPCSTNFFTAASYSF